MELLGHTASVSGVQVDGSGVLLSSSYDRTLKAWHVRDACNIHTYVGHKQPITAFDWYIRAHMQHACTDFLHIVDTHIPTHVGFHVIHTYVCVIALYVCVDIGVHRC